MEEPFRMLFFLAVDWLLDLPPFLLWDGLRYFEGLSQLVIRLKVVILMSFVKRNHFLSLLNVFRVPIEAKELKSHFQSVLSLLFFVKKRRVDGIVQVFSLHCAEDFGAFFQH